MEQKAVFENISHTKKLLLLLSLFAAGFLLAQIFSLLVLVLFFGTGALLNSAELLSNYTHPDTIRALKIMQVINAFFLFIVPPLVFARLVSGKGMDYLRLRRRPVFLSLILSFLIIFSGQAAINWMVQLNERMHLPEFMEGIEQWMKNAEQNTEQLTKAFLKMSGPADLLVNLFIIAVLAAIGEELFFRGAMQRVITDWSHNIHIGIWVTAILFSALHLQFYGFLPRMVIGAMLGYMYAWTGSLWIPITGHFINNGMGVIVAYYIQRGLIPGDIENLGAQESDLFLSIVSVLMTGGWFALLYRNERKHHQTADSIS